MKAIKLLPIFFLLIFSSGCVAFDNIMIHADSSTECESGNNISLIFMIENDLISDIMISDFILIRDFDLLDCESLEERNERYNRSCLGVMGGDLKYITFKCQIKNTTAYGVYKIQPKMLY